MSLMDVIGWTVMGLGFAVLIISAIVIVVAVWVGIKEWFD